ncbi:hypothetical protein OIU74_019828 [Salix koriyanagi]|uniref:Uncharacterized protein n=1 Tax=Salix koriyanagi TaxID=2511006 RepID=A0A9Q0SKU0_9ROSI|nr:hypothetical protein OIU74_019828 [Salix koriyanagi]
MSATHLGLAIHQLAPGDTGDVVDVGVTIGVMVAAGGVESGSEFGFIMGVDVVGVVGVMVGTVVIGVVMSLRLPEIEFRCSAACFAPWSARLLSPFANLTVTLDPGFKIIKSKVKLALCNV